MGRCTSIGSAAYVQKVDCNPKTPPLKELKGDRSYDANIYWKKKNKKIKSGKSRIMDRNEPPMPPNPAELKQSFLKEEM